MDTLGDIVGAHVTAECLLCQHRGVYRMIRLLAQFGPSITQLDLLRHLTASCRYQHWPGAPPVRNYESGCQARLMLPPQPISTTPTPIQRGLNVEVWKDGGSIEWHLATVWSFELGHAVLDAAAQLYPDREVTLRQACRVLDKREKPG